MKTFFKKLFNFNQERDKPFPKFIQPAYPIIIPVELGGFGESALLEHGPNIKRIRGYDSTAKYIRKDAFKNYTNSVKYKKDMFSRLETVFDGPVCDINNASIYAHPQPGQKGLVYNANNELSGKGVYIWNPNVFEKNTTKRPLAFNQLYFKITHLKK